MRPDFSEKLDKSARRPRRQFLALITLPVPRFGRPKRGVSRIGPDVAEIGPVLRRFGPKSGRPEVMAGWLDFF